VTETTDPTDLAAPAAAHAAVPEAPEPRLTEAQRLLLDRMSAPPGRREGLFPATAAQRGMWMSD